MLGSRQGKFEGVVRGKWLVRIGCSEISIVFQLLRILNNRFNLILTTVTLCLLGFQCSCQNWRFSAAFQFAVLAVNDDLSVLRLLQETNLKKGNVCRKKNLQKEKLQDTKEPILH